MSGRPELWTRRSTLCGGMASAAILLAPASWAVAGIAHPAGRASAPHDLRSNLLAAGLAVPCDAIRLSWIVPDTTATQAFYQVQIADAATRKTAWDSGRVTSSDSIAVPVPAALLQPDRAYTWRVKTWDGAGRGSLWSTPALLITAPRHLGGDAIWASGTDARTPADWALLRRAFTVAVKPVLAWLRVTATSPDAARQFVFRLWLNGTLVGVGPARSPQGDAQPRYATFDVTSLVRSGGNVLASQCYSSDGHAFQAELVLLNADASRTTVASDNRWRTMDGGRWHVTSGYTGGGFYQAPLEAIDARAEPVGWRDPGFEDRAWRPPLARGTLPAATPEIVEAMVFDALAPHRIERRGGSVLLDFGKEAVGGLMLRLAGPAGAVVEVRLGEELTETGDVRYQLRCGQTYREFWTLRDGEQDFEHWGYRPFRWAEILLPQGVTLVWARMRSLALPWREEAPFESADPNLDKVRDLCAYSIRATRMDLYQDTPARERGPYEGDAIVNQLSEYAVQRSFALARYSNEYLLSKPSWPTEYRLMAPILAWRDYMATGDDRFLRTHFESMVDTQLIHKINAAGLVEKDPGQSSQAWGDLVDWPKSNRDGFVFCRVNTVVNAWQYAALVALADIATVIGRTDRAATFHRMANRLRDALNAAALLPDGRYRDGIGTGHSSQHATAFAVALGLASDPVARIAAACLAGQNMLVSVYGSQFLLEALYRGGQADAALALMTSDGESSWRNMIERWGATITMEAWDPSLKPNTTFSHAWATGPVNIIANHLAGVTITKPGAECLRFAPQPGRLAHFRTEVPTIRGPASVTYRGGSAGFLEIGVPANSRADLHFTCPSTAPSVTIHAAGMTRLHKPQAGVINVKDLPPGPCRITWNDTKGSLG